MNDKVLSIIIPVFNNINFTKKIVEDLNSLPNNCEIVVVDNGSTDGTDVYCKSIVSEGNSPDFKYIKLDRNLGFGRANNIGYEASIGSNVLFLNNDVKVQRNHSNWHEELVKECEAGHIVATQLGLLDKSFNFVREGTNINIYEPLSYLSGWFLGASRKTFDKLILNQKRDDKDKLIDEKAPGPWNELYELYFEDDDLSFRARKLAIPFKIISVPLTHIGRVTGKKYNMFYKYHESRRLFIKEWKGKV